MDLSGSLKDSAALLRLRAQARIASGNHFGAMRLKYAATMLDAVLKDLKAEAECQGSGQGSS